MQAKRTITKRSRKEIYQELAKRFQIEPSTSSFHVVRWSRPFRMIASSAYDPIARLRLQDIPSNFNPQECLNVRIPKALTITPVRNEG